MLSFGDSNSSGKAICLPKRSCSSESRSYVEISEELAVTNEPTEISRLHRPQTFGQSLRIVQEGDILAEPPEHVETVDITVQRKTVRVRMWGGGGFLPLGEL